MDVSNCPDVCAIYCVTYNGCVLFINSTPMNRWYRLTKENCSGLDCLGDRSDVVLIRNNFNYTVYYNELFAH